MKKPVDCCWSETFFKEMWFQAVSTTFRMVGSLSALDSVNREFGYGTWKKNSGGIWRVQELSWKILRQNCHGHLRYQISLAWRQELVYGVMPRLLFVAKGKMLPWQSWKASSYLFPLVTVLWRAWSARYILITSIAFWLWLFKQLKPSPPPVILPL